MIIHSRNIKVISLASSVKDSKYVHDYPLLKASEYFMMIHFQRYYVYRRCSCYVCKMYDFKKEKKILECLLHLVTFTLFLRPEKKKKHSMKIQHY